MNYRDDMTDIMHTYGDASGRLSMTVVATAAARADARSHLSMRITDGIAADDPVEQKQIAVPVSGARAEEAFKTVWHARQWETSQALSVDSAHALLREIIDEYGRAGDVVRAGQSIMQPDSLNVKDVLRAMQSAAQRVIDEVVASGGYTPIFRYVAAEVLKAADEATARQAGALLMVSALKANDAQLHQAVAKILAASALFVADAPALHIEARLAVTEQASVDAALSAGAQAMAWTANASTWATSRYLPYDFNSIAVIDGHLYGTAADGVYRLDDAEAVEEIHSLIRTGQIEVSPDVLARLESVYCVYEAKADVTLAVEQTQPGQTKERYEYALPEKVADVLTTGRFKLGKGLNGRTFTFELIADGEKANFVELKLMAAAGKRRL